MKLITNSVYDNHAKSFNELLYSSNEVFIAVAFFKKTGFNIISKAFNQSLEKGNKITLVCGLDFYQTEPEALKEVYSLSQKYNNCKLMIKKQDVKSTFHPKIYYFKNEKKATLIIGSANFTKGGFESNFELSISSTFELASKENKEITSLIDKIKNSSTVFSNIEISNYARKYQIHKRNEKESIQNY